MAVRSPPKRQRAHTAHELPSERLRRTCDPASLGFDTTAEVKPLAGTVGQPRARDAIAFGLDIATPGYNLFVSGPIGTGKRTSLEEQLAAHARHRPSASDWVYLHNFADPRCPVAVELPRGRAPALAADMRTFVEDAKREVRRAFESESYGKRRRELVASLDAEREKEAADLSGRAEALGLKLELTPVGMATVPLIQGRPISAEDFSRLPAEVRAAVSRRMKELEPRVSAFMRRARELDREALSRQRELDREVGLFAVGHLIDELKERYAVSEKLQAWFDQARDDVADNLQQFHALSQDEDGELPAAMSAALRGSLDGGLSRYEVNVLVTGDANDGAPVVFETSPTYPNVLGRIEHKGVFGGALVTDHRMLRAGAIHRANGGYLMLPALDVLTQPLLWLKLKDVLRTGRIRLENPAEQYALIPTATQAPEPIDLNVKVVLVGPPPIYSLAYELDEDLRKLFRVKVEFDSRMPWRRREARSYAGFLSAQVQRDGLRHFDSGAVARVVEHGARLAGHHDWLSTRFLEIAGLAAEASHWAGRAGSDVVKAEHVDQAIEEKVHRSSLLEERLLELVAKGALVLDVDGERVGQVNGLSVIGLGDYAFGHPVRISATAGAGRGDVLSIDRETKLSGPLHDKGFLILSGYIRGRYGGDRRLALSATLAFEQSYEEVEGDSAASAELYALMSDLAGAPLRQDIAVTGSVDQHGDLQAIGGVNEKIEGFFRACSLKGLTGSQGVLIPEANAQNLMLSPEVVAAAEAGRFHVWTARNIDAGIELLTGVPAGRRRADGGYPPGTIHARVAERLERFSELAYAEPGSRNGKPSL